MKTIAIFSAYYYPHLGGIERYIDNLMKEFISEGYKVLLITSNYQEVKSIDEIEGIKVFRLPVYNMFKNRYPIIKKNKEYKKIIKELEKNKIDAIIVNTRFHLTSHVGAEYGAKHNIPVYLVEHGSNYITVDNKFWDFFANRYERYLTKKIKNKITGFYGVSQAAADWIIEFEIKSSGVWYNSIDTTLKIPKKTKHKEINFLYAGRLIKQKGVENILISFTSLLKKYKNINLYIAGDGPELDYYKENYNNNRIVYLGKLPFDELLKVYAKTDIFLYPPLWPEGLPTSILEAGLCKISVIGTSLGGNKEVLTDRKNGLIVDTNQESLEVAMEELICNEKLRTELANNLYEDVVNKFSWKNTSKQILIDMFGDKNEN